MKQEFKTAYRKRTRNIIKDALHTNQSNIGFISALESGLSYKRWNNGRSKGRTRPWHKARLVGSVEIEDYFDIYGSYHAQVMYPGDLNGGAENVANCRCWLSYSDIRPGNLKSKGSTYVPSKDLLKTKNKFNILPSSKNKSKNNQSYNHDSLKTEVKTTNKFSRTISSITNKVKQVKTTVTKKVKQVTTIVNHSKNNIKSILTKKEVEKLKGKFKDYSNDFKQDSNETKKELIKTYPTPLNLSATEKTFIVKWGIDSALFIKYFREKLNGSKIYDEYYERYYQFLNRGINKYDNIKVDSILHRRVNNDFYIEDVGNIGKFDTHTSTTFNSLANKKYGEFHITILAPKGSKGAYIEELMKNETNRRHLNEWLLPDGTKYKTLYKDYKSKEAVILLI